MSTVKLPRRSLQVPKTLNDFRMGAVAEKKRQVESELASFLATEARKQQTLEEKLHKARLIND
jgi:hypothetical protein